MKFFIVFNTITEDVFLTAAWTWPFRICSVHSSLILQIFWTVFVPGIQNALVPFIVASATNPRPLHAYYHCKCPSVDHNGPTDFHHCFRDWSSERRYRNLDSSEDLIIMAVGGRASNDASSDVSTQSGIHFLVHSKNINIIIKKNALQDLEVFKFSSIIFNPLYLGDRSWK